MKAIFQLTALLIVLATSTTTMDAQNDTTPDENLIYITAVAWNSTGSKIAAVGLQPPGIQGFIQIIDAQTGEILQSITPRPGGFSSVAWSPDDRLIAAGGYDQVVWIIDVETGSNIAALYGHRSTITGVDWNSDSTKLVSSGNWDGLTLLWDMTTYSQIHIVEESGRFPLGVAFSPDDQRIAIATSSGLRVYPAQMDEDRLPSAYLGTRNIASVVWSNDGRLIAAGEETFPSIVNPSRQVSASIYILDSLTGAEVRVIETPDQTLYGIDWSLDDTLLATYGSGGTVRIWDVQTGNQLQVFSTLYGYPVEIAFSPYGGRLAFGRTIPANDSAQTADVPAQRNSDGLALANGAVQIVVPAPSPERLQAIAAACGAAPAVEQALSADITAADYAGVITQVEALPADALPLGCAADLLAMAQALATQ
jgi:WD40 repeat protein